MTDLPVLIGPYRVDRELGRGGMGEVYLATDSRLDRQVAIKALPAHLAQDPDRLARFQREAKVLASLNHSGIGAIYGFEEANGRQYLILEFVAGETLADRIVKGPIPVDEALPLAKQVAEALEVAHEKGVIHRDLKPGNVMVTADGVVKVLDFGLARSGEGTLPPSTPDSPTVSSPPSPTMPGAIMGTAAYMSPEQARGKPVDKRTDIWSFGVVLYEMLTGACPFGGETVSDSIGAVLHKPIDLSALPAPPAVRQVVERCLERDRSRRYRDIGDVGQDLARALLAAAPDGSGDRSRVPARSMWIAGAIGVLGVIGAVAMAVVLWRHMGAIPEPPRYEKLTSSVQFITNARFTADGRTVVFSAARERMTSELFVRRPEDIDARKLGASNMQVLAISARGELAILTRTEYLHHRTYIGTLARMPLTEAPPRDVLGDVTAADWSPDGTELAVIRRVSGASRLEYPIGTRLAQSAGYLSDLRISPDGRHLAFMAHDLSEDNRGHVVIIDRTGAEVARSPHYRGEEGLAWAPDGKSVFYSAQRPHGDYMIWAMALDGAVRAVLTGAVNMIAHDVHADGRVLVSTETNSAYLVTKWAGQPAEREVISMEFAYPAALSPDGASLLYTDESVVEGPNYAVRFQATADSPAVRLGEGTALDLSPDGQSVLVMVASVPPRLKLYPIGAGAPLDITPDRFVSIHRGRFFPDGTRVLISGAESGAGPRCYVRDLPDGEIRAVTPEGTDEGRISPDGQTLVARRIGVGWSTFSIAGGGETPLPALGPDDEVAQWGRDGRSLLVFAGRNASPRIERFDIATGRRTLVQELGAGRMDATSVWNVEVAADEESYSYTFDRSVSVLYAVEGVR